MLYLLATTVLLATLLSEAAARREWLPYWVARKILHVTAIGACALAVTSIERSLFTGIVAATEILLLVLVTLGKLLRDESGRPAWGIVWFPLALLLLLLFVEDTQLVSFSMWTLAVCDPAATVIGKLFGKDTYALTGDPKSLQGNVAFVGSFILLGLLHPYTQGYLDLGSLVLLGVILATVEALGSRGMDNLFVPLLTAFFLQQVEGISSPLVPLLLLVSFSAAFYFLLTKRGSLTGGGSLTAALLGGVVMFGTYSTSWLLPLALFLVSSSIIGRLFPGVTSAGDAQQKQPRNATQVLANGGCYGLIIVSGWYSDNPEFDFFDKPLLLLLTMAIATADTWSSEIGQHYRQPTYDVLRWRSIPPGLSGGISPVGTLAGFLGAAFIALSCSWLIGFNWADILMITVLGFSGMLVDSLLGAAFQGKYLTGGSPAIRDDAGERGELVAGFHWMTNDLVNFLAIGLVVGGVAVLFYFF